jgi:hypothetical protein
MKRPRPAKGRAGANQKIDDTFTLAQVASIPQAADWRARSRCERRSAITPPNPTTLGLHWPAAAFCLHKFPGANSWRAQGLLRRHTPVAQTETGPATGEEWRDGRDVITAPSGLVER